MRSRFRVVVTLLWLRKNDESCSHPRFGNRRKHSPLDHQSSRVSSWRVTTKVRVTLPVIATSHA
jgi:hypothetical protein